MSISFATNGVSVNNQAAYRKGEYFRAELPEDNTSAARWLALTNLAVLNNGTNADIVATSVGHQFLPRTPEHFTYDNDGNLTQDGHWNYTWDAENRLVKLVPSTTLGPQISLQFEYDWRGRRIHKQVWPNAAWSGTPTNDVKFVYDGWNLIGILNSSFTLQTSFVWGSDLSGSIQGAGGVGGLLFIYDQPSAIGYAAPAYDGNGNVMALVSMSGGTNCAAYEYGPFGEVIRATGPMAKANPFRFSTKYQDDETDLVYYGFRYYNASTGRWLSRDPLGDKAFLDSHTAEEADEKEWEQQSLLPSYLFVHNNSVNRSDTLGLYDDCCCTPTVVDIAQKVLVLRYQIAQTYLDPHRPRPMPEIDSSWSCFGVSLNIGHFMARIPPCWTCYMEERWNGWRSHDLNVVVCASHPKPGTGAPKKIYFDYWHHAPPAQDYSVFLKHYPRPGIVYDSYPGYDCSNFSSSMPWTPNWSWLDIIIAGP